MFDITRARGLYAIVDPELCLGRDPLAVAEAILAGGCGVLQLRAKRLPPDELERLATRLLQACHARAVPLVINDHWTLAQQLGADGIHLGQSDVALEQARARLGPAFAIGLSTHDLRQALAAQARGADVIGFGPVFATRSKLDPDPVVGLDGLREVCGRVSIPVVAIGGITLENVERVAACGPALVAAIGALCGARDPEQAARAMHRAART